MVNGLCTTTGTMPVTDTCEPLLTLELEAIDGRGPDPVGTEGAVKGDVESAGTPAGVVATGSVLRPGGLTDGLNDASDFELGWMVPTDEEGGLEPGVDFDGLTLPMGAVKPVPDRTTVEEEPFTGETECEYDAIG